MWYEAGCKVQKIYGCFFLFADSDDPHVLSSSLFPCLFYIVDTPRYTVGDMEKQATFTGAQQRAGVYVLPFIFQGLFGLGRRRPAGQNRGLSAGRQPP